MLNSIAKYWIQLVKILPSLLNHSISIQPLLNQSFVMFKGCWVNSVWKYAFTCKPIWFQFQSVPNICCHISISTFLGWIFFYQLTHLPPPFYQNFARLLNKSQYFIHMNICLLLSGLRLWKSTHPYLFPGDIQIPVQILFSEVFHQSFEKNFIWSLPSIKAIYVLKEII